MDDPRLRADFHRALDAVAPPAPWLVAQVRREWRERRQAVPVRARGAWWRLGLSPQTRKLVAALLLLALLSGAAAVTVAIHEHLRNTVPAHPTSRALTPRLPSSAGGVDCFGYGLPRVGVVVGSTQYGSRGPIPIKMLSQTTVWAEGGLLTTDGGAHWRDVSPPALRQDEPTSLSRAYLPPSYSEFYLDADHAWMARGINYGSQTVCYDHVVTFATSDGGRSWQQSKPIAVQPTSGPGLSLNMLFIDAQHGLLWVGQVETRLPDLYATNDGGRAWRLISQANGVPGPCTGFVSPTVGWSAGCGLDETSASLEITHDGGVTWQAAQLPVSRSCTWFVGPAAFFDQLRAVTYAYENCTGKHDLFETSDGGTSWRRLNLPPGGVAAMGFIDAQNFWALTGPALPKGTWPIPYSFYRSGDGGATWTLFQQKTPITLPINMQFVNANHGMLAEEGSCAGTPSGCTMDLRVTADGGHTWTLIHPRVS